MKRLFTIISMAVLLGTMGSSVNAQSVPPALVEEFESVGSLHNSATDDGNYTWNQVRGQTEGDADERNGFVSFSAKCNLPYEFVVQNADGTNAQFAFGTMDLEIDLGPYSDLGWQVGFGPGLSLKFTHDGVTGNHIAHYMGEQFSFSGQLNKFHVVFLQGEQKLFFNGEEVITANQQLDPALVGATTINGCGGTALQTEVKLYRMQINPVEPPPETVQVVVSIDRLRSLASGCGDELLGGAADFTLAVTVGSKTIVVDLPDDQADLAPRLNFDAKTDGGVVPVKLGAFDRDPVFDTQCDLNPSDESKAIEILYNTETGEFTGDSTEQGSLVTTARGTGNNAAEICFMVSIGEYANFCSITPVQIVFGQDVQDLQPEHSGHDIVDLVADMRAVAFSFAWTRGEPNDQDPISFRLLVNGAQVATQETNLQNIRFRDDFAELYFTPTKLGRNTLVVEAVRGNYISRPTTVVEVSKTSALLVAGMQIVGCNTSQQSCYSAPTQYLETWQQTQVALDKYYPSVRQEIVDSGATFHGSPDTKRATSADTERVTAGNIHDLVVCAFLGELRNPSSEFFVAVINQEYRTYHEVGWLGVAQLGGATKCALATEGLDNVAAHELGHMLGVEHTFGFVRGFDIGIREFVRHDVANLMCPNCSIDEGAWPDAASFNALFRALLVRQPKQSRALVMGGVVQQDGSVQLSHTAVIVQGTASLSDSGGSHSVVVKNRGGVILNETLFTPSFTFATQGVGEVEADLAPFVLTVPIPDGEAAQVEIQKDGETLLELVCENKKEKEERKKEKKSKCKEKKIKKDKKDKKEKDDHHDDDDDDWEEDYKDEENEDK